MPVKSSTPDAIENVESSAEPASGQLEEDRVDITRRILFKLDTRYAMDTHPYCTPPIRTPSYRQLSSCHKLLSKAKSRR
jgi:hypothetical protein